MLIICCKFNCNALRKKSHLSGCSHLEARDQGGTQSEALPSSSEFSRMSYLSDTDMKNRGLYLFVNIHKSIVLQGERTFHYNSRGHLSLKIYNSVHFYTALKSSGICINIWEKKDIRQDSQLDEGASALHC